MEPVVPGNLFLGYVLSSLDSECEQCTLAEAVVLLVAVVAA